MGIVRKTYELAQSFELAVERRARVLFTGKSPVPPSCQIPGLNDHYRSLGFSDSSGIFVEIGGFDGESFSNTSFLADQGWRGVYVEPVPHHARRIRLRHIFNRVSVEQVAVAQSAGHVEMAVMGPLTTADTATEKAYDDIDWAQGLAQTKQQLVFKADTLENILSRNKIPRDFDLMVIDIEGGEEQVIDDLLMSAWRPAAIVIELVDLHPDFINNARIAPSNRATRQKLKDMGYREIFVDEINTIFARPKG